MPTTYPLFLITFLGFPFISLVLSKYVKLKAVPKLFTFIFPFFALLNMLFLLGYSVKGDYFDYYVFSIEYFFCCYAIFLLLDVDTKNWFTRIFRWLGLLAILLAFINGTLGVFFFEIESQDYEADKVFHFVSDERNYETRRYSFGFATLEDTRYTFETYRQYQFWPVEKKIDKSDFFGMKTNLNIYEDALKISINKVGNRRQLVFKSTNGKIYAKPVE